MNIVFDTNVVLDVLLDRKPFAEPASVLFDACERSVINGFLCASSVTTIHYLVEKSAGRHAAIRQIKLLLELFEIAPVNRTVLFDGLALGFGDYEDAVIHQAALGVNADGIVTRNPTDFKKARIQVYSPQALALALT